MKEARDPCEIHILIGKWVRYRGVRFAELSVTFTLRQYILTGSPIENTDVAYIENVVSEGWCAEIKKKLRPTMKTWAKVSVLPDLCTCCLVSLTTWPSSGTTSP